MREIFFVEVKMKKKACADILIATYATYALIDIIPEKKDRQK